MRRGLRRFLRSLPLVGLWVDAMEDKALERRMRESRTTQAPEKAANIINQNS